MLFDTWKLRYNKRVISKYPAVRNKGNGCWDFSSFAACCSLQPARKIRKTHT